jgi:hypothetical protein
MNALMCFITRTSLISHQYPMRILPRLHNQKHNFKRLNILLLRLEFLRVFHGYLIRPIYVCLGVKILNEYNYVDGYNLKR